MEIGSEHNMSFLRKIRELCVRRMAASLTALVAAGTLISVVMWCRRLPRHAGAQALATAYEEAARLDDLDRKMELSSHLKELGEEAIPALELMYRSDIEFVRIRSTELLAHIRSCQASSMLLDRLKSSSTDIRCSAIRALCQREDTDAVGAILFRFRTTSDLSEKIEAAAALGHLYHVSSPRPAEILDELLASVEKSTPSGLGREALTGVLFCRLDTDAERQRARAVLPKLLDILTSDEDHVMTAYEVIVMIAGREFAGVRVPGHHESSLEDPGQPLKGFGDLPIFPELRQEVAEQLTSWMQLQGMLPAKEKDAYGLYPPDRIEPNGLEGAERVRYIEVGPSPDYGPDDSF